MLKNLIIVTILSLVFNSSFAQDQKDTMSLNDMANLEISKFIKKQPPIIRIAFYLDGKRIKRGYKIGTLVNGVSSERMTNNRIVIDTGSLKEGDTLAFLILYSQKSFYSDKFSYKRFLHGGELVVGFISDYGLERKKFLADNSTYFEINQANELYNILTRTIKIDKNFIDGRCQLGYSVVKSNISPFVNFKYDFIPRKGSE